MNDIPHASVFIREEREARGWSDVELAVKMGEDTQTNLLCLHMYEHVGPTDANLRLGNFVGAQIAKAFGLSLGYILALEGIWRRNQSDAPTGINRTLPDCHPAHTSDYSASGRNGDDLQTLSEAATPGCWKVFNLVRDTYEICKDDNYSTGGVCVLHSKADADFIVAAVNHVRAPCREPKKGYARG